VPVIKRNKKSLIARILGKFKTESLPYDKRDISHNIPLDDIGTDSEDVADIARRRKELKATRHGSSDAIITIRTMIKQT